VFELWPGWQEDISHVRSYGALPLAARHGALPLAARRYVERVEDLLGVPIRLLSIGPEHDALLHRAGA
jgi:adenylosuccinate synthase